MDNQFGTKAILWAFGSLLLAIGGQPLLTYVSGDASLKSIFPSLIVVGAGVILVVLALFWKPKEGSRSASLFERLGRWGSSPIPYALVVFLMWFYFETLAVRRNIELASLRNDQQSITQALDRFVLPRQLSERQMDSIGGYLKQFPSVVFSFDIAKGDEEAGQYAADLGRALEKGGWHLSAKDPYTYVEEPVYVGLSIGFRQAPGHAQMATDYRNPGANLVLQEAFGLAGVIVDSSGSGTDSTTTEDEIRLTVGHRRRDSYALPCKPI
jgi:hypothetical protein